MGMNYSAVQTLITSGCNILFSGAASGADTLWGALAKSNGHKVVHYHFDRKYLRPDVCLLDDEHLDLVDGLVHEANETLNRSFPTKSSYVNNLIRRNAYQIMDCQRIYAVAPLQFGLIKGGTAWAVQMYLDRM